MRTYNCTASINAVSKSGQRELFLIVISEILPSFLTTNLTAILAGIQPSSSLYYHFTFPNKEDQAPIPSTFSAGVSTSLD